MTGEEELAVRQARGAAAAAREFVGRTRSEDLGPLAAETIRELMAERDAALARPCAWGDDAWHRAVTRLIRIHRPDYRRLLAEERGKTGGEQP